MIGDFILQTANAPGAVANVNLIAAPTGRSNFSSKFANGAAVFYFLDDGTIWECGYGTLTSGSPDVLSRDTVLSNSSGTTSRLNFAGALRVYNEVPSANMLYKDKFGVANLPVTSIVEPANAVNTLTVTNTGSNGANIHLSGNGSTTQHKWLRAVSGQFHIVNSAYSAIPLTLTDAGALTVTGAFACTGGAAIGGALTGATTGAFSGAVNTGAFGCTSISCSSVASTGAISGTSITGTSTITGNAVVCQSAGLGSVQLACGDATHTGYTAFYNATPTRMGYCGFALGSSYLNLIAESSTVGWSTNLAFQIGTSLNVGTTIAAGGGLTCTSIGASSTVTGANFTCSSGTVTAAAMNCSGTVTGATIASSGNVTGAGLVISGAGSIGTSLGVGGVLSATGGSAQSGNSAFMLTSGVSIGAWGLTCSIVSSNAVAGAAFATTSDRRLKTEITDLTVEQAYAWINDSKPRTYVMDGRKQAGFIAQEDAITSRRHAVISVPDDGDLFKTGDEVAPKGQRLHRDYAMDNAYLTAAVKGLLARVAELEARDE